MAFRKIGKRIGCKLIPPRTVTISKRGQVNFSYDLYLKFKDKKALLIYLDTDYGKLAFEPTDNPLEGYLISKGNRSKLIQCWHLSKTGIVGAFPARFTEGKVIVEKLKIKKKDFSFFVEEEDES